MSTVETSFAARLELEPAAYATLPDYDAAGILALLQAWSEDEDVEEQRETLAYLQRVLNEDRYSDQKVFP